MKHVLDPAQPQQHCLHDFYHGTMMGIVSSAVPDSQCINVTS